MLKRIIKTKVEAHIDYTKALIISGARQVGKTTLIKSLVKDILPSKVLWVDGDDPAEQRIWDKPDKSLILQLIQPYQMIVFDEAQRFSNIGLSAKMIVDAGLQKQVILSGSSSLDIAHQTNEPLTGRKWEYTLYPFSFAEIREHVGLAQAIKDLPIRLVYGSYPEVFNQTQSAESVLKLLASSYLYKDILAFAGIRKPEIIIQLLQALAYQVGQEVSYHELSNTLGINKETVMRYINLLEKSYVIFRLSPLARNERNEISTTRKIYFYDNGIRNAVIDAFKPLTLRNDQGALWENYIISEFQKKNHYQQPGTRSYFWRSTTQTEIDYVEELHGDFVAYEIKWNSKAKVKFPPKFMDFYKPQHVHKIDPSNFFNFL